MKGNTTSNGRTSFLQSEFNATISKNMPGHGREVSQNTEGTPTHTNGLACSHLLEDKIWTSIKAPENIITFQSISK